MANDRDLQELLDFYSKSEDNVITLPSGQKAYGDLKEFFEVVDFFAERYGIGDKTLEEYVEMLDNTDPMLLNILRITAINRSKDVDDASKTGSDDTNDDSYKASVPIKRKKHIKPVVEQSKVGKPVVANGSKYVMRSFLRDFGVTSKELNEACDKLDDRKIELKDYSYIDKHELLTMSPEKFRETLKEMGESTNISENFRVSEDTIMRRYREQG